MFLMKPHYHSVGLLDIHMVSDSHSLSESPRKNGHETLTSGLEEKVPVVNWSQLTRYDYKENSVTTRKQQKFALPLSGEFD